MGHMQFPLFTIDVMMSPNHCIIERYAEELTDTGEKVTGNRLISLNRFVEDNKGSWL